MKVRLQSSTRFLTKKKPEKSLLLPIKKKAGRSSSGRITVRHQGGGAKRLYRIVDFGEEKINIPAKIIALEYDPNRTSFIALLAYSDGEKKYVIAPQKVSVGDDVIIAERGEIKPGNRMKVKNIPVGTLVYNVELESGKGGKIARGAGTSVKILGQEGNMTYLQMVSSEIRKVPGDCFASIGEVSRPEKKYIKMTKAGQSRFRGIRPTVRGSAMNPPDHPHGGGEGRSPIGMPGPKTPWGKPALGVRTRKQKWTDKYIVQRRKKKKK